MFLSGYDTLKYSWAKVMTISSALRILYVTLQNINSRPATATNPWLGTHTTPQPRNGDRQSVGISRYTAGQSVGINLYRWTAPVGASPVSKSFYRQTLLIPTDSLKQ